MKLTAELAIQYSGIFNIVIHGQISTRWSKHKYVQWNVSHMLPEVYLTSVNNKIKIIQSQQGIDLALRSSAF